MRKITTTVHKHPRHSPILPALIAMRLPFSLELKSSLHAALPFTNRSSNPGATITLSLNYINNIYVASKHQKNSRMNVLGNINMPLLHDCTMMHFTDLATYYFLLQMLYLYLVHTQSSRISTVIWYLFSSSPLSARLQFRPFTQYDLLTNDLLLPQRSHGIPICPKH